MKIFTKLKKNVSAVEYKFVFKRQSLPFEISELNFDYEIKKELFLDIFGILKVKNKKQFVLSSIKIKRIEIQNPPKCIG